MRRLPLIVLLVGGCAKPVVVETPAEMSEALAEVVIPPLPLWTHKYADTVEEQGVFLRISAVMARYGMTRLDAVEVQNHLRDQRRVDPQGDLQAQLDEAVARVRRGDRESGVDPAALAAARFVVVFDVDETLWDQSYRVERQGPCHDLAVRDGMEVRYIKTSPHWETAFEAVRGAGGKVAIFSANVDDRTLAGLRAWTWEDRPLTDHPDVLGVFTNSHLVLQDKAEGSRKAPVVEPSKDLRIFDEGLAKVILVDDNPWRTFQPTNLRLVAKLDADLMCDADADPVAQEARAGELARVAASIRDAAAWLDAHPEGTFRQAFLPFTWAGSLAVDTVAEATDHDWPAAMDWVREHPEVVPPQF
ncbi:MAG: hypothetical protein H6732_06655 [Alphaproteobacteria bacterium]|nr:hypothetical protein [Alphaproteobacteria bacterium]